MSNKPAWKRQWSFFFLFFWFCFEVFFVVAIVSTSATALQKLDAHENLECAACCGRSWILQRCEDLCYKYKGLGKCVLLESLGQRIYKALVTARSQEVISTGTIRLEKPDQQRFQSCHGMRGGEGAPSWISAVLIKEIRNALGKIKIRPGSAGGVHLAQGAVPFLSGEGRLRALLTHLLRILSPSWG